MRRLIAVVVLCVGIIGLVQSVSSKDKYWGTNEEREQIISQAISIAKENAKQEEEQRLKLNSQQMKPLTSTQLLAKGFKKPSKEALREGRARLLMEDMVYQAEKKLFELKKQNDNSNNDPQTLVEDLSQELFHRPGSLLKKTELDVLYAESECEKAKQRVIPCCNNAAMRTFRTYDGTCNNLANPLQGAARTPFRRLIAPFYEDGISSLRGTQQFSNTKSKSRFSTFLTKSGPFDPPLPSPRFISRRIVRNVSAEERPLTHVVMQWGQFLDHDLDLGPEEEVECEGCHVTDKCKPIRVPLNDPSFASSSSEKLNVEILREKSENCLPFRRSILACTENTRGSFSPSEQLNDLTSYLDGSQVYGSNEEDARNLRTDNNGLLKTSSRGKNLPTTKEDCLMDLPRCFLAGDVRSNEHVGLTAMHTLWVREHNRIATKLKSMNSDWSDERLYQETRKIVGAVMQKITYKDYLPLIFGYTYLKTLLPKYKGYDQTVDASIPNSFATGAYRYGHSLIRPVFSRFLSDLYERGTDKPLNLVDSFFNQKSYRETNLGAIFRGLVTQNSLKMDESMNKVLTTQLFQRKGRGMDLAALNIQRQRDHGMAPYTVWRNFCQAQFKNLPLATINRGRTLTQLLRVYRNIENVDFWLGGITEKSINGGVLGPTFACIQSLTFQNLRDGDRFWYENKGVFTPQQKREIERASLSRVICDNTVVNQIQLNAFVSNQRRISCDRIPEMDLNAWSEKECYIRVNHVNSRGVRLVSSYKTTNGVYHTSSGKDRLGYSPTCLPIECPSNNIQETIGIYPRSNYNQRRCRIRSVNRRLPSNTARQTSCYYGKHFSQSLIDAKSGIYSSLSRCQIRSATPAVTYTCNRYVTSVSDDFEQQVTNTDSSSRSVDTHFDDISSSVNTNADDSSSSVNTNADDSSSSVNTNADDSSTDDCNSPTATNCTLPFESLLMEEEEEESNMTEEPLFTSESSDTHVNNNNNELEVALNNEEEKSESKNEERANLMAKLEETIEKLQE